MSEKSSQVKKFVILFCTFIVPLLFFLFLASGKVNFNKLPIMTEKVSNLKGTLPFRHKVSVVSVLGENPAVDTYQKMLNLYQVIYKSTAKYKNFQMVTVVTDSGSKSIQSLKEELAKVGAQDLEKWKFIVLSDEQINTLVSSFEVPSLNYVLADGLDDVFIVDEELNLRGRIDDEDSNNGLLFSYDTGSVAVLKNKLREDLKVVFYESKFAVKE